MIQSTQSNLFEITALSAVDTYKLGHVDQLPEGVEYIYSNFTPRFDKHFAGKKNKYYDGKVVIAGIRTMVEFINRLWNETFFKVPLEDIIAEYTDLVAPFVTGEVTTKHVIALHNLGFLPVEIRALDEGLVVNTNIPVLTVCNTVAGFGWVVGFLEDLISAENWKVSTNATTARLYRKIMEAYATKMGVPLWFVNYQGHDFSLRGLGGIVDGSNSGQGHLMYFEGTDNLPAVNRIRKIYGDKYVGCSVSATEHLVSSSSILTSGIEDKQEAEAAFFKRYITEIYPSGICSYVSDTYDYWGFLENVLPEFVDVINARGNDANGMSKVVVRPDSGDPVHVVAGYRIGTPEEIYGKISDYPCSEEWLPEVACYNGRYYFVEYNKDHQGSVYDYDFCKEISMVEAIGTARWLKVVFGSTMNEQGYSVISDRIGIIYGDSITLDICSDILERLDELKIASSCVVFGIGSFTYNFNTRDSFGYAMKGTWCRVSGKDYAIFKDPKTSSSKKSARGLLSVVYDENDELRLFQNRTLEEACFDTELNPVFVNSTVNRRDSFAQVRERALKNL